MPWPGTFENIPGGVDIAIFNVATPRTEMRSDRERLLDDLPTAIALLRGVAGVHSDDLMSGTCSLGFKDVEECAPGGVHDGFRQGMVLHHVENTQLLNSDHLIAFSILLRNFEVMVAALAFDLQMGLRCALRGTASAMRAFLAAADGALLASECALTRAIVARVVYHFAFTISQEGLETDINPNVRMLTHRWGMLVLWLGFTHNQGVPVPIGTQYQMDGLGSSLKGTVQFDLDGFAHLFGDDEMLLVFMQIYIFAVLPQLDGVRAIGLFEAGKAHIREIGRAS